MFYIYVPTEVHHVWAACCNVYTKDALQHCKVNTQKKKCLESSAILRYHGSSPLFLEWQFVTWIFYCAKWRDDENKWEGSV